MIINIETTAEICSVALSDGTAIKSIRESEAGKSHASLLTVFIEEILSEYHLRVSDLDAVAVSKGPGSYTGLRIGVSTAKGLCYGAHIPLIAVPTLSALVYGYLQTEGALVDDHTVYCPMIDARRMEVYTAIYNAKCEPLSDVKAMVVTPDCLANVMASNRVVFLGTGAEKCREVWSSPEAVFSDKMRPSAEFMAAFSWDAWQNKRFEDVAYFEPYYLKDFVATIPKNKL